MTKAVIFDMDGLMYDTERIIAMIWLQVAEKMNFPLTASQCNLFRGSNMEYKRGLFRKWYGDTVDYDEAYRLRQSMLENYLDKNGVPVKKGLMELLTVLKQRGYKIAVATSSARYKAKRYWDETGVGGYIDESVCGDEVTHSKPEPEIFLKAAEKLGVDIKECLILEDSPNGLKAAHSAGATVIMIPDLTQPDEEIKKLCNYIFEDLSQVISILQE